jgi:phospholipid-binding lipoprotein MlaA
MQQGWGQLYSAVFPGVGYLYVAAQLGFAASPPAMCAETPRVASMRRAFALLFAGFCLAGCVTLPDVPITDPGDPLERSNRVLFNASLDVDRVTMKPAAKVYRKVPKPLRDGLRNFINNLNSVNIFANDVLQAQPERAGITLARAVVNTTIGVGGIFEVAQDMGLPRHSEDFGQTLAVWGVGEGSYLIVPLIGPATTRDLFGRAVDFVMDPIFWIDFGDEAYLPYALLGMDFLDLRERNLETLDDIEGSSADFYASVRSLYRQARQNEIRNGATEVEDLPDF